MLLSFSIPEMLPMIRAGLRQRSGEDVGTERVKRQTIRKMGERGRTLLKFDPLTHTIPYDLELWWKSRTPERERIGTAKHGMGNAAIKSAGCRKTYRRSRRCRRATWSAPLNPQTASHLKGLAWPPGLPERAG